MHKTILSDFNIEIIKQTKIYFILFMIPTFNDNIIILKY